LRSLLFGGCKQALSLIQDGGGESRTLVAGKPR
jgi:hypothetical protein